MVQSVDGFVEGPDGRYVGPRWSGDLDRWSADMIERFDTLIYGRVSWEQMAAYWPQAERSGELSGPMAALARFMNGSRKVVFSRQRVDLSRWAHSEQADADVGATVAALLAEPGRARDVVVFAGAEMAHEALRQGAVDEVWILTVPELVGGGLRMFPDDAPGCSLACLEVRPMDTGAVFTRYAVGARA